MMTSDTTWIAEWTFDSGGSCDARGWEILDNRILNDGSNYWDTNAGFDGMGNIAGQAAVLSKHDLCWDSPDGYGNDWDYAIVCAYSGADATLSFDYLLDSEAGNDLLSVEADEHCASEDLVDYTVEPGGVPSSFRQVIFDDSGINSNGTVAALALPDFGAPTDTHCVYIRFYSDDAGSPEDGTPTGLGAALVVDNVQVTGGLAYTEAFEGPGLDPNVAFVNSAPSQPFGTWARLYPHATDNDVCTENTTCAWIFSDPTLPAYSPEMAFGPGGAVVRNWLDNVIVGPWVSVPPAQNVVETILSFDQFGGNRITSGWIVRSADLRGNRRIANTDTAAPGDSLDCVSPLIPYERWNSLGSFYWSTQAKAFVNEDPVNELQVRFRVSDWQFIQGVPPPSPLDPGPGPYIDRVRIGRRTVDAPVISDAFLFRQAQDNFPSVLSGVGDNYIPSTDRFGTSDFAPTQSAGYGLCCPQVYWHERGDSILVRVQDVRNAGGIARVDWHGAIVAGPHAGKSPPPWNVESNGFFTVPADTAHPGWSHFDRWWFVDVDDDYFRGGDVVHYFWSAEDVAGGYASFPQGLTAPPVSVTQAEEATGGLFEVSYLPTIDWDPSYLARIAEDVHGKLEPTAQELANSRQRSCILYNQMIKQAQRASTVRRSGPAHRTSFMHTLDKLGYGGLYDTYDHVGGVQITNNHLAGWASVEQATGYTLIVVDAGWNTHTKVLPQGYLVTGDDGWFDQTQWYRDWLAQAPLSDVGQATLWILGENLSGGNPLLDNEFGAVSVSGNQGLGSQLQIEGQTDFVFADGTTVDFTDDIVQLDGRNICEGPRDSDGLGASGSALVTHRYRTSSTVGDGAAVMNANPTEGWNTMLMTFWWQDLRGAPGPPSDVDSDFTSKILNAVLPESCQAQPDPTTNVPERDATESTLPRVTTLHPNSPNPFNPTTVIRFDLARDSFVSLRIFDVAGRLTRTLVNRPMERERHRVVWDGMDDNGKKVASGLYFYRLRAGDFTATRKMVVLR